MVHMFPSLSDLSTNTVVGAATVSVFAALVAAVGFVCKLCADAIIAQRNVSRQRRAQLVQLDALLKATRVGFDIQREHADRLAQLVVARMPDVLGKTLEDTLSRAYKRGLNDDEQELHRLIRAITEHSLKKYNQAVLDWLGQDTFFKARRHLGKRHRDLAEALAKLQLHLMLWLAKYEMWIPDRPEHALVYLADEEKHGIEFPHEIDAAVQQMR